METDAVIIAVGQRVAAETLPGQLQLTQQGTLSADPITMETDRPGVFAAGDMVTGPADVITAIASGKEAARSIVLYLQGNDLRQGRKGLSWRRRRRHAERQPSRHGPLLDVALRRRSFAEVEGGFPEEVALEEARRCLHCAVCSECEDCKNLLAVGVVDESAGTVRIPEDKLRVEWISATEGEMFARVINDLAERLGALKAG